MKILVIPSNRRESIATFFDAWRGKGGWDQVILIEDGPECTFRVFHDRPVVHVCWRDIDRDLGNDAWIISRRDSAIRCYGLFMAWRMGAEHVLTLDDDCLPHRDYEKLMDWHLQAMELPKWASTVKRMRVRGLPYGDRATYRSAFHIGLWSGSADLDARTELDQGNGSFMPPIGVCNYALGEYFPVSGMNLCIERRALPLFWFPLMGEGQPYKRFDDIWAGVIAKKCCDHLGWIASSGEPFVHHVRASVTQENVIKETPGLEANEEFWRIIDSVSINPACRTAQDAVVNLGWALEKCPDKLNGYIGKVGKALRVWARLFA